MAGCGSTTGKEWKKPGNIVEIGKTKKKKKTSFIETKSLPEKKREKNASPGKEKMKNINVENETKQKEETKTPDLQNKLRAVQKRESRFKAQRRKLES